MNSKPFSRHHVNFAKATALALAAAGLSLHSAKAQTTWDGGGGTNVLNTDANWTTDTLPSTSATWAGTPSGSLSLVWNADLGDGANGMSLNVNAGQTGALNLNAANGTSVLNISGITVANGAGAFSIGNSDATASSTFFWGANTLTNNDNDAVAFRSDALFNSGGGVTRTLTFNGSGSWTFNSGLYTQGSGGLALNVNGAFTTVVTLNGASVDPVQNNSVNFGTLSITNGDALGSSGAGTLTIAGSAGTKRLMLSNNVDLNAAVANINIGGKAASASDISTDAAILNQSGNNSISGKVTFAAAGGTFINIHSQGGMLTLNGGVSANVAGSTAARNVNFAGAGNIVVNGTVTNGADDPVGISKTGSGTTTLTNANTYSAGTTVTAGTLLVNNATGSGAGTGAVNVTGGRLGGTGSIGGGVTVGSGAVLAPGAGIESLGVGALTLNDSSTFAFELNTTSVAADLVYASGANAPLTLNDSVTLSLSDLGNGDSLAAGTKLTLISYNTGWNNGTFNGLADDSTFVFGGNEWLINYNDTTAGSNFTSDAVSSGTSFVTITAVPEPTTFALTGLACLGAVAVRRRSAH